MTTLLEIKPFIHDFVEEKLDSVFTNKVYWLGERRNVPNYPYCLLSIIAENKDKRTSHHQGNINDENARESITTRYKTCTITVCVYNAWVENTYDSEDMDITQDFTYEQIDNLESAFEDYPINKLFSIQTISPIRPLHEVTDGGYIYRYEFDLTIGYNEEKTTNKEFGRGIDVYMIDTIGKASIDSGDIIVSSNDYIENNFEVAIGNNDTIDIEKI